MTKLPYNGVKKYQQRTTFHNNKDTIHWSNKISTANYLSEQQTTFHNNKATIHWSNKNLDDRLLAIMIRLQANGVKKSQ